MNPIDNQLGILLLDLADTLEERAPVGLEVVQIDFFRICRLHDIVYKSSNALIKIVCEVPEAHLAMYGCMN